MKVKSKAKNSTTKKRSSYGGPKPLCNQDPEMEDCFNRSVRGKCGALTVADYPCGQFHGIFPLPAVRFTIPRRRICRRNLHGNRRRQ